MPRLNTNYSKMDVPKINLWLGYLVDEQSLYVRLIWQRQLLYFHAKINEHNMVHCSGCKQPFSGSVYWFPGLCIDDVYIHT